MWRLLGIAVLAVALIAIVALTACTPPQHMDPDEARLTTVGPDKYGVVCYIRPTDSSHALFCVQVRNGQ